METALAGHHTEERHVEIGPGLTEDIFKQCERELGERWWR